jgi:heptosyltransferase-1
MRILLLKTSSMGDILHTLPAITDAGRAYPNISFDWVIEDAFAEIAHWSPLVKRAIPLSLRRWRKAPFSRDTRTGFVRLCKQLRERPYDLILDAQGLVKSAALTWLAKGPVAGLDFKSAREGLAAWFYKHSHRVNFQQHAIVRMRQLFSLALDYPAPSSAPDFGLVRQQFLPLEKQPLGLAPYLVFLFGTTWTSKQWPQPYWQRLAALAGAAGHRIMMSGNQPKEIAFAENMAQHHAHITVVPGLGITDMARLLAHAKAAVAVDTGLGHLAAALGVPTLSLYGPTDPAYTGAMGPASIHLAADFSCAPCLSRTCHYRGPADVWPACYGNLPPERVWESLQALLRMATA